MRERDFPLSEEIFAFYIFNFQIEMSESNESEDNLTLRKVLSAVFYGVSSWYNSSAKRMKHWLFFRIPTLELDIDKVEKKSDL